MDRPLLTAKDQSKQEEGMNPAGGWVVSGHGQAPGPLLAEPLLYLALGGAVERWLKAGRAGYSTSSFHFWGPGEYAVRQDKGVSLEAWEASCYPLHAEGPGRGLD